MFINIDFAVKLSCCLAISLLTVACVTETIESSSSMKFSDAAIVSVQNPDAAIVSGSTFSWLPSRTIAFDFECPLMTEFSH